MVEKSEIKIVVRKINFFARGSEKGGIKFMAGTRCIRGSEIFVRDTVRFSMVFFPSFQWAYSVPTQAFFFSNGWVCILPFFKFF